MKNGYGNLHLWICGVSLHDTSAEARNKQAKQLLEYAKKKVFTGNQQLTDSTGSYYI